MEKIPCIKCTPELWEYIKPYLEEWGYSINDMDSFYKSPLLCINRYGLFGQCTNFSMECRKAHDRELVTDVEEFLERAAKLKGFTYKRKDSIMEFHGVEIKPGMVIVIDEPTVLNVPYIVFPRKDALAVIKYGATSWGKWCILEEFIENNYKDIKAIYDTPEGKQGLFGNIIWKKGPEEIVLTMDEIAKKFGVSVEQIKIKK